MSTLTNNLVSWWDFSVEAPDGFIADQHGSNPLSIQGVTISDGAMNVPAACLSVDMGAKDFNSAPSVFNPNSGSFTIAAKIKLNDISQNHEIFSKWNTENGGWRLYFSFAEGEFVFQVQSPSGTTASSQNFPVVATGQYYSILAWYDADAGKTYIQVDHNSFLISETSIGFSINPTLAFLVAGVGSQCDVNTNPLDGSIKQASYWNRVLTANERKEIWNSGTWLTYQDIKKNDQEVECRETRCCPPDQFEVPVQERCFPCDVVPEVEFNPPTATAVEFPIIVFLTPTVDGASVYYTTDGTTPTIESILYESPITLVNSTQVIRAFAVLEGCPEGPVSTAIYIQASLTKLTQFSFLCDTPDFVGQWGVFAPSGVPDYHWQLQTNLSGITAVTRIEIYQVNSVGVWDSGQAWSTAETIHPVELGGAAFIVFPLVLFNGGQINSAYTDNFSSTYPTHLAAGAQTYNLYGEPASPLAGYFKCIIFWSDGSKTESIITTICGDPPPPPCPLPPSPSISTFCYGLDVTFTEAPGLPFRLLRRPCLDPDWTTILDDVIATNPQTYHDVLSPGTCWCYLFQVSYPGCPDYVSGTQTCGTVPCEATITISADKTEADVGGEVCITWSSTCIEGDLTSNWDGSKPVSGTQCVPMPDDPSDQFCFTLEGSGPCNDVSASVCVQIKRPPPCECPVVTFYALTIRDYTDGLFNITGCDLASGGDDAPPGATIWNGIIPYSPTFCSWGGDLTYNPPTQITYFRGAHVLLSAVVFLGPCVAGVASWILQFSALSNSLTNVVLWQGVLATGSTGRGTYVRTSGCALFPTSITLI